MNPQFNSIEGAQWLFQPPRYRNESTQGAWHDDFWQAAGESAELTWDVTAILSVMSFAFVAGDRTLVREVRRQQWMSYDSDGSLAPIPEHGLNWGKPSEIASGLLERLEYETLAACEGAPQIHILLSGGLDSRIVAGVYHRLLSAGKLSQPATAVTWGLADSRDVHYGKMVAERLGFKWIHLPLAQSHLEKNICELTPLVGNLSSPIHFHRMDWFESLDADALVLGGSYGDSVGRSEFSGRTVLELTPLAPRDRTYFLNRDFQKQAAQELTEELASFTARSGNCRRYVALEHEQQGHYMRGNIAHIMSVITRFCRLYQLFTAPSVYGYMWSFHPAVRTDRVYNELLGMLGNNLIEIPWARTNVALNGSTRLANPDLRDSYHNYRIWAKNILADSLLQMKDFLRELKWLDQAKSHECLETICKNDDHSLGLEYYEFLIWLLSLKNFCDRWGSVPVMPNWEPRAHISALERTSQLRLFIRKQKRLNNKLKRLRRAGLRLKSRIQFPPEY